MNFTKKDLIYFVMFMIITYISCNKSTENMSNTDIKKIISEEYKIDVDAVRNLSKLANDLTIGDKLDVPGGLTLLNNGGLNVDGPVSFLPKGSIIAWNGTTAPKGWALCDGKNGTPNLKGRFIYGYGASSGNKLHNEGGSETHTLKINEIPSHKHDVSATMSNAGAHHHSLNNKIYKHSRSFKGSNDRDHVLKYCCGSNWAWETNTAGNHKHNIYVKQSNKGSNGAHNNMPPYHVLAWIMKL